VGMEIQFLSVAAIAYRTYYGIVKIKTFSVRKATTVVSLIWLISMGMTVGLGSISDYYLVANDTFCFYDWKSPLLMYWAWPLAFFSLTTMGYCYYSTFRALKQTGDATVHVTTELDIRGMEKGLAFRLLFLIVMFVMGYAGIIFQSFYEYFIGHLPMWADITFWVIVLFYWLTVAMAYAHANPSLGVTAVLRCKARGEEYRDNGEVELSSPWSGPRPSVGLHIKPYAQMRNLQHGENDEWDMGLDMTRSGYRVREEEERSEGGDDLELRSKTPPSPSRFATTMKGGSSSPSSHQAYSSLPLIPHIPSYDELHPGTDNSPTKSLSATPSGSPPSFGRSESQKKEDSPSPLLYEFDRKFRIPTKVLVSSTGTSLSGGGGEAQKKNFALSLEEGMMPREHSQSNLDLESPQRRLLDAPPSPSQNFSPFSSTTTSSTSPLTTSSSTPPLGLTSLSPSLSLPPPQHSSSSSSSSLHHSSSDEEEDDGEIDPIMALTKRKLEKQQALEQSGGGTDALEVPTVTSLLYTISEEPTPKPTPGGPSGAGGTSSKGNHPKGFFTQSSSS